MKNLIIVILVTFLLSTIAPKAQANNVAQNLCEFVAADAKSKLRSYLKSQRIKIRRVFDTVECNGKNLLQFAASANANETGAMMIGKLPKSVVSENLTALANTGLKVAAEKRVNG
ncbi:DUF3718 domain-containing protein [Thalassotalea sp. 1_MG-2023]|uniref:DUF3718 domain-containing protein n=1 Tax=Thalassotalea sp. 1_MG-2023 TaxID=3062680 RepID=UPI0026E274BB|nr:DUF3718 domain-containing protein [Thalassotalea sp. 1_MG-2023]MDO6428472.1 DUF3718 domain-containing protein [Thalassotalea sp. 1_MG-2023]